VIKTVRSRQESRCSQRTKLMTLLHIPRIYILRYQLQKKVHRGNSMSNSKLLGSLNGKEMDALRAVLHETQGGKCFICEDPIDLSVHAGSLDIDHVIPSSQGGKDEKSNFALTHSSCNRSKQASDLRVARILARFERITRNAEATESRGANLGDILRSANGAASALSFTAENGVVRYSLDASGDPSIHEVPLLRDELSKTNYFFASIPVEYLHHDERINPRNIGSSLSKLVKEFHDGFPQLHVALAWVDKETGPSNIMVFDGQHKAAAQILLGTRSLPVRVFVAPDPDVLLAANTRAGTTLRQVAFDKSVQRRLGSSLFAERVARYRTDHGLLEGDESFSEKDVVSHFKGQTKEVKKYALDNVRSAVIQDPNNKMAQFVEFGGRGGDKPLSYSTIEKTYLSRFICGDVLETSLNYRADEGLNPRTLETEQIVGLMNIVAETTLIDCVDPEIAAGRLESKVAAGEVIDGKHLRAHRMSREEIVTAYVELMGQVIRTYFTVNGKIYDDNRLFQNRFDDELWDRLKTFVKNFADLPMWVNHDLANTAFGGRQRSSYWAEVFRTGKSPDGMPMLASPLDLMAMIKD